MKKCHYCNFRGFEFLIWVNLSFQKMQKIHEIDSTEFLKFPHCATLSNLLKILWRFSWYTGSAWKFPKSQIFTAPSSDPETKRSPLGHRDNWFTLPLCPVNLCKISPEVTSQTLTCPSPFEVKMLVMSGKNAASSVKKKKVKCPCYKHII